MPGLQAVVRVGARVVSRVVTDRARIVPVNKL